MAYQTIVDGKEWEFRSSSNPTKRYRVILNDSNVRNFERAGMLSCNCPGWIFNAKRNRMCKHCEEIMRKEMMVTEQMGIIERKKAIYGEV